MTILIDGDLLLYKCCAAAEVETVWDDNLITMHSSISAVRLLLADAVDTLRSKLGRRRKVIITLSHRDNFRKMLEPTYKGNRISKKPIGYLQAVEYVREAWDTVTLPALEADDVMGIMATSGRYKDPIIVTEDKDLKQIDCSIFNPRTNEFVAHDPMFHMVQTLAGDRADGYGGCPGYGEISARKLLESLQPEEWWPAIVAAYVKKGLTESEALLQARLAYMLQSRNYNRGKIKLWEPTPVPASGATAKSPKPATAPKKPSSAKKPSSKTPKESSTKAARPTTVTKRARTAPRTPRTTTTGRSSRSPSSRKTSSRSTKAT